MVKSETLRLNRIFQALSDATRRAILRDLAKREKTVGQIAQPYRMSLAAVSKHLKILEAASLIHKEKRGSFYHLRLNPTAFTSVEQWLGFYQQFWETRLDALKNYLEQE
ncbi:MAG: winged helix-turn-helix transcriptional regulator [Gammaproteobacteria bacterium]|nr:winged helix-turn-helix transcriptional regulator [Gammaproteobacteria bacterium]